jgi:hypothetical protein
MISPRTDALSGFLGVDGKQHRELRWLERAALCGERRDEPRTTEFEQKSRKTPSQARRGHLPRLGRTGRWRRFDTSSSPYDSLAEVVYSPCETCWQLSPVSPAILNLSSGLLIGRAGLLFSERAVSLRSSGLYRFGTVLEIRSSCL